MKHLFGILGLCLLSACIGGGTDVPTPKANCDERPPCDGTPFDVLTAPESSVSCFGERACPGDKVRLAEGNYPLLEIRKSLTIEPNCDDGPCATPEFVEPMTIKGPGVEVEIRGINYRIQDGIALTVQEGASVRLSRLAMRPETNSMPEGLASAILAEDAVVELVDVIIQGTVDHGVVVRGGRFQWTTEQPRVDDMLARNGLKVFKGIGVYLEGVSSATLDGVDIQEGVQQIGAGGQTTGIVSSGRTALRLRNSEIRDTQGAGLLIDEGSAIIENIRLVELDGFGAWLQRTQDQNIVWTGMRDRDIEGVSGVGIGMFQTGEVALSNLAIGRIDPTVDGTSDGIQVQQGEGRIDIQDSIVSGARRVGLLIDASDSEPPLSLNLEVTAPDGSTIAGIYTQGIDSDLSEGVERDATIIEEEQRLRREGILFSLVGEVEFTTPE